MPSSDTEPFSVDGGDVGVVLSHGFTGSPASMRPWAEHLAAAGYSVRAAAAARARHQLAGREPHAVDRLVRGGRKRLRRTRDPVHHRLRRRAVHGRHAGHPAGRAAAGRLGGLVLVNPSYGTDRRDARLARYIAWAVKSRPAIGGDIKKPGVTESAYDRTPVVAFVSLQDLWRVTLADLGQVTAPVLLFRSREDHVVEPSSARRLQQGATSTSVREVVLENSYHVATLDNDAETIFGGSVEFIAALTPAAADRPIRITRDPRSHAGGHRQRRRDNGLLAPAYVPLTDVAAELGDQALAALGRARIAAYLIRRRRRRRRTPAAVRVRRGTGRRARCRRRRGPRAGWRRERPGRTTGRTTRRPPPPADPLTGVDTDAAFADIIADWHVDTSTRSARPSATCAARTPTGGTGWSGGPVEEPVWLDDDHYVPPPPPPLPRLAAPTILAMSLIAVSILLLGLGGAFGLATDLTMLLGVGGVLLGAWMLIMRLRERPRTRTTTAR